MTAVYVIDTGSEEVYTIAANECEAGEHVCAVMGLDTINYVEWYSDDPSDIGTGQVIV